MSGVANDAVMADGMDVEKPASGDNETQGVAQKPEQLTSLDKFFNYMSRDVRNVFYEVCGEDKGEIKLGLTSNSVYGKLDNGMNTALLQSAHDIGQEYREILQRASVLTVRDHEDFEFGFPVLPANKAFVAYIGNLHIKIIIFCNRAVHTTGRACGAEFETMHHIPWIYALLNSLPGVRGFTLDVFMCYSEVEPGCLKRIPCEKPMLFYLRWLRALPGMRGIRVYRHDHAASPELEQGSVLFCSWLPEYGEDVLFPPKTKKAKKEAKAEETKSGAPGGKEVQAEADNKIPSKVTV